MASTDHFVRPGFENVTSILIWGTPGGATITSSVIFTSLTSRTMLLRRRSHNRKLVSIWRLTPTTDTSGNSEPLSLICWLIRLTLGLSSRLVMKLAKSSRILLTVSKSLQNHLDVLIHFLTAFQQGRQFRLITIDFLQESLAFLTGALVLDRLRDEDADIGDDRADIHPRHNKEQHNDSQQIGAAVITQEPAAGKPRLKKFLFIGNRRSFDMRLTIAMR